MSNLDDVDYFAARALQGILECNEEGGSNADLARRAYDLADAMMYRKRMREAEAMKKADRTAAGAAPR